MGAHEYEGFIRLLDQYHPKLFWTLPSLYCRHFVVLKTHLDYLEKYKNQKFLGSNYLLIFPKQNCSFKKSDFCPELAKNGAHPAPTGIRNRMLDS